MTKDELAKKCYEICKDKAISSDCEFLYSTIMEFFSQNVVIPKGSSRHPYADVWHEWLEDTSKTLEYFSEAQECWVESPVNYIDDTKWRIKPNDPAYEWQWLVIYKNSNSVGDFLNYQNYMTVLEASNHYVSKLDTKIYNIVKIEETKRERHEEH